MFHVRTTGKTSVFTKSHQEYEPSEFGIQFNKRLKDTCILA